MNVRKIKVKEGSIKKFFSDNVVGPNLAMTIFNTDIERHPGSY